MRISIGVRLVALGGTGVLGVVVVSGVAVVSSAGQAQTAQRMAVVSDALGAQWHADMMHDGIRADVMAALYTQSQTGRGATDDLEKDVAGKATTMVEAFDRAAASGPAALRDSFASARPTLVDYTQTATTLVRSVDDPATVARTLPEFNESFETLEEDLGSIDEALLVAVERERAAADDSADRTRTSVLSIAAVMALLLAAGTWLLGRAVLNPVRRMRVALTGLAERDLTQTVEVTSDDELGDMSKAFNTAVAELRATIGETGQSVEHLVVASEDLNQISTRLGRSADETAGQAASVTGAASTVSDAAGAMSQATHQMDQAIREIATRAASAASVAVEAVDAVGNTTRTVGRLTVASQEIGGIVRAITAIAEQTNLLALNATIEAARAGESGKGFAVVATEVKELAHQTAGATEDITNRIATIQAMSAEATTAIEVISEVIGRISENQSMIAAAVEEQSATTAEMSRSVDDVSSQAEQITGGAVRIAGVTESTAQGADQAHDAAEQLGDLAQRVTVLLGQFRV